MTCEYGPFGLKIQVSSIRNAMLYRRGGYQAMKCMEHVKSNHQLAATPRRIYQQICHGWPTRQYTLPHRYPSARQPLLPTSRRPLSLIGENAGLADIEIDNN